MGQEDPIPALMPRAGTGFQFVAYGDCCIGPPEPGREHAPRLAQDLHAAAAQRRQVLEQVLRVHELQRAVHERQPRPP